MLVADKFHNNLSLDSKLEQIRADLDLNTTDQEDVIASKIVIY